MTENIGTSTTFLVTCARCGEQFKYTHQVKYPADANPLIMARCEACKHCSFGRLPRRDGLKMRKQQNKTELIQQSILEVFDEVKPPMTVRQMFYALSSRGVVPKEENKGYRVVQRNLTIMRREGSVPYHWIADNTRWCIAPTQYNGLTDALETFQEAYRRDLWASQNVHVEIWVEKDALAGVISNITKRFGVQLFVARGFSSITFAAETAAQIEQINKEVYIYHFGDYDADGVFAAYAIKKELESHGANFHFERAAITPEQIRQYGIMTRPQKPSSPRSRWWKENYGNAPNAELDGLPVNVLRRLVQDCITRHIDSYEWSRLKQIEAVERSTLKQVLANMKGE